MNYLNLAFETSLFSVGISRPNPAVGAVVVKDGIVVGKGRTQRPGNAHAEVMALRDAGELARGAAIYVTLEPCCHYGRTPPCTKAIIDAGIAEVYFAHADPNPLVRGKSRAILEEAGIAVYEGEDACIRASSNAASENLEELSGECADGGECRVLGFAESTADAKQEGRSVFAEVERYFEAYDYFVCYKRTFVEVKSAVSEDGFMGCSAPDGRRLPLKITGDGANCWNHELRAMSDAVLVGAGTLLADNPSLDVRYAQGNSPVKVVWAGHHEFTDAEISGLKFFTGIPGESRASRLIYACVPQPRMVSEPGKEFLSDVEVVLLPHGTFAENWRAMVDDLSARGMHRLMVEPGERLAREIFDASPDAPLWNRLDLWRSTDPSVEASLERLIESGSAKCGLEFPGLPSSAVAKESAIIGPDVLTVYCP